MRLPSLGGMVSRITCRNWRSIRGFTELHPWASTGGSPTTERSLRTPVHPASEASFPEQGAPLLPARSLTLRELYFAENAAGIIAATECRSLTESFPKTRWPDVSPYLTEHTNSWRNRGVHRSSGRTWPCGERLSFWNNT